MNRFQFFLHEKKDPKFFSFKVLTAKTRQKIRVFFWKIWLPDAGIIPSYPWEELRMENRIEKFKSEFVKHKISLLKTLWILISKNRTGLETKKVKSSMLRIS